MKFFKSRFFIVCVIVALLLVVIPSALSIFGYTGVVRGALKTIATPFEWCGSKIANGVSGFVAVFRDYDDLRAENEELRATIESMQDKEYENSVLRDQNKWLKEYLDFKNDNPALMLSEATVIARESGSYSTVLTLNKGTMHGIKKNMPVITEDGVFGYVSECGPSWSKVVSIIETASSVGVYSERAGVTGVVEGSASLRQEGICLMTYINASADIKVGDRIFTGGNGTIYPSGLLVGEIVEISADEATRTLTAKIKPAVDLTNIDDINKLMIIVGSDKDSGGSDK